MIRVAIIVGTTRPGRKAETVARWFYDIADFELPLLDEPVPPSMGQYSKPHTNYREWNNKAAGFVSYGSAHGARAVEHPAELSSASAGADLIEAPTVSR